MARTGDDMYNPAITGEVEFVQFVLKKLSLISPKPLPPEVLDILRKGVIEESDQGPAEVYINHDRWVVDCPFCPGAELSWGGKGSGSRFFCLSCFNAEAGYGSIGIAFPGNAPAIEAVLNKRPDFRTRNWRPGETIQDLQKENQEMGVI